MKTYKVAVVGAGPAGYFTALAFQKAQNQNLSFSIDLIEKLPTPWGLVRSGVAPDHQKIKTVAKVFEKIAKESSIRLFANVELGKDVSLKDLKDRYDAVVLATGASVGRKLGVSGEDLDNSFSAADFVPWYNAHPDYKNLEVDLTTDTAVVIGNGNVALDVARILISNPSDLEPTDIANHALSKLKKSDIRRVIICGRRGPEHVAFSSSELRNMSKLENINYCIDSQQIEDSLQRINLQGEIEKEQINNLRTLKLMSEICKDDYAKKIEMRFFAIPYEIKGKDKVEEVVFTQNIFKNGSLENSGNKFSIKCGLVITAIGYNSAELSGAKIVNGRLKNIAGHVEHNLYTTGWAKRGSNGVIGTNKSDSVDVVNLIIANLKEPKISEGLPSLLRAGHEIIDQLGWEKINAFEMISGELVGKPRLKEVDLNRLIKLGRS